MTFTNLKKKSFDIAILGAGCAGMSLAYRLHQTGYVGAVLVIEQSESFSGEQRWCSWGPIDPMFEEFVSKSWKRVVLTGQGSSTIVSVPNRYCEVPAARFLTTVAERLKTDHRFTLATGITVTGLDPLPDAAGYHVETSASEFSAKIVFDARNIALGSGSPQTNLPWLYQSFVGHVVQAEEDVFDPNLATLMDFDIPGGENGAFMYVLPYTQRQALIESTLISSMIPTDDHHIKQIEWYIANKLSAPMTVLSQERGVIPMTSTPFQYQTGENLYNIGSLGGALKPSTGYAFARIQHQVGHIAKEIVKYGRPLASTQDLSTRRRRWLDSVFLTASRNNEKFFSTTVIKMAKKLPSEQLVSFLAERESAWSDLCLMLAVGNSELARAAIEVFQQSSQ